MVSRTHIPEGKSQRPKKLPREERRLIQAVLKNSAREHAHKSGKTLGISEEHERLLVLLDGKLKPLLIGLSKLHPEVFEERKHEFNGPERLYWYLGYISALKDYRQTLTRKMWPVDAADPSTIDLSNEE